MLEQNKNIALSGEEAMDALREVEFILISLHKMGSYYGEKPGAAEEYRKATTDFIDDCAITHRLAKIRTIISKGFDDTLGDDDMDDVERHCSDLEFWRPDQPLNKKKHETDAIEFSGGTIQQVTCKRKGVSAVGAEICGIYEEKDPSPPQIAKYPPQKNGKSYCLKASINKSNIFTVTANTYSIEKI